MVNTALICLRSRSHVIFKPKKCSVSAGLLFLCLCFRNASLPTVYALQPFYVLETTVRAANDGTALLMCSELDPGRSGAEQAGQVAACFIFGNNGNNGNATVTRR